MISKEGRECIIDAAIFNLHRYCFGGDSNRRELSQGDLWGTIRGNELGHYLRDGDVEEIIDELISNFIIEPQDDKFAGRFFLVKDELISAFKGRARNHNSPLFQMNRFGSAWIASAARKIYEESETDSPDEIQIENIVDEKVPGWNQSDASHQVSQKSIDEIRIHLGECTKIIAASDFTQEEKAQISGLLQVCEQLIELPAPKVGLIKQVLGWLRDIAAIKELVDEILKHLDL